MKNRPYTQEQKDIFIDLATDMGIGPAIRDLGYPSSPQAHKWFEERGIEAPTIDSLQRRAAEMKHFYSDQEKKYAVQRNIERIVESLESDTLKADDINKLSNALNTAIKTFNLIEGKSTEIRETQTKDGADLGIQDILSSARAKNALIEENII